MWISFFEVLIIAKDIAVDRMQRMSVENIKKLLISLIFLTNIFYKICMLLIAKVKFLKNFILQPKKEETKTSAGVLESEIRNLILIFFHF